MESDLAKTLGELRVKATRARVLESRVDNRWQITLDFRDDKDAMRQFSDAYRTGKLVVVPDDAVERMVELRTDGESAT